MKEKTFQTKFNKFSKYVLKRCAVFELKITETDTISFNAVHDHQEVSLQLAKHDIICYKIPDDTIGYRPFDSFCMSGQPAYVVIMFNAPSSKFVMIDIDDWLNEKTKSTRRSLTFARACEIGELRSFGVS